MPDAWAFARFFAGGTIIDKPKHRRWKAESGLERGNRQPFDPSRRAFVIQAPPSHYANNPQMHAQVAQRREDQIAYQKAWQECYHLQLQAHAAKARMRREQQKAERGGFQNVEGLTAAQGVYIQLMEQLNETKALMYQYGARPGVIGPGVAAARAAALPPPAGTQMPPPGQTPPAPPQPFQPGHAAPAFGVPPQTTQPPPGPPVPGPFPTMHQANAQMPQAPPVAGNFPNIHAANAHLPHAPPVPFNGQIGHNIPEDFDTGI